MSWGIIERDKQGLVHYVKIILLSTEFMRLDKMGSVFWFRDISQECQEKYFDGICKVDRKQ